MGAELLWTAINELDKRIDRGKYDECTVGFMRKEHNVH